MKQAIFVASAAFTSALYADPQFEILSGPTPEHPQTTLQTSAKTDLTGPSILSFDQGVFQKTSLRDQLANPESQTTPTNEVPEPATILILALTASLALRKSKKN